MPRSFLSASTTGSACGVRTKSERKSSSKSSGPAVGTRALITRPTGIARGNCVTKAMSEPEK